MAKKKRQKNGGTQPSNGGEVKSITNVSTVEEALKQLNITYEQTDKTPAGAEGKISTKRPYWNLRTNDVFFMCGNETYHAKIPSDKMQVLLETVVQIDDVYIASRVLNCVPDCLLTKQQQERKRLRNEERRYRL